MSASVRKADWDYNSMIFFFVISIHVWNMNDTMAQARQMSSVLINYLNYISLTHSHHLCQEIAKCEIVRATSRTRINKKETSSLMLASECVKYAYYKVLWFVIIAFANVIILTWSETLVFVLTDSCWFNYHHTFVTDMKKWTV